jgi:preprotein translocase subunit SecG
MTEVLLAIHLMVAVALVLVILLQRSEGGGLGIGGGGGGGGGMGGFMSARGTANLLTRATGLLAACFFVTSLSLAIIADSGRRGSIADEIRIDDAPQAPQVPAAPVSQ